MTLIEFHDMLPIENVAGALVCNPDKVIFMGWDSPKKVSAITAYADRYFRAKKKSILVSYIRIKKYDVYNAVRVLERLLRDDGECIFDITGGCETMLIAMGMVAEKRRLAGLDTYIISVNPASNKLITYEKHFPFDQSTCCLSNSVEENALLHGGGVLKSFDEMRPNFTADFSESLEALWQIAMKGKGIPATLKYTPSKWNLFVSLILANSERNSSTHFVIKDAEKKLGDSFKLINCILEVLEKTDLIKLSKSNGDHIVFDCLHNTERVFEKAGNLLEIKIYKEAKKSNAFSDVAHSVNLDWDGRIGDTENEIDVMLMKGLVPVFISCKNGKIGDAEVYKLNSVAHRFGGSYARKVLVVSDYGGMNPKSVASLRRRASDMGIRVIDYVHTMSDKELSSVIAKL